MNSKLILLLVVSITLLFSIQEVQGNCRCLWAAYCGADSCGKIGKDSACQCATGSICRPEMSYQCRPIGELPKDKQPYIPPPPPKCPCDPTKCGYNSCKQPDSKCGCSSGYFCNTQNNTCEPIVVIPTSAPAVSCACKANSCGWDECGNPNPTCGCYPGYECNKGKCEPVYVKPPKSSSTGTNGIIPTSAPFICLCDPLKCGWNLCNQADPTCGCAPGFECSKEYKCKPIITKPPKSSTGVNGVVPSTGGLDIPVVSSSAVQCLCKTDKCGWNTCGQPDKSCGCNRKGYYCTKSNKCEPIDKPPKEFWDTYIKYCKIIVVNFPDFAIGDLEGLDQLPT